MEISASDFEYISKMVRDRSAIVLETGKEYLVESRLFPVVKQEGLDSLKELVKKISLNNDKRLQDIQQ